MLISSCQVLKAWIALALGPYEVHILCFLRLNYNPIWMVLLALDSLANGIILLMHLHCPLSMVQYSILEYSPAQKLQLQEVPQLMETMFIITPLLVNKL